MQKNPVNFNTRLVRGLALCMAVFMPIFMSFFSGGTLKEIMVFYVGDLSPFLEGAHTAHAATISGVKSGPATCTGKNAATGGDYTQPSPGNPDGRRYCYGLYNCPPGGATPNPNTDGKSNVTTCVNPVTGADMTNGMTCSVGTHTTGYGSLNNRALPSSVMPCSCQGLTAFGACTGIERGHRMAGIGAYIVNGCHTEYSWDSSGRPSAKQKCEQYIDARTNTVNYQGVPIANANGTPLGTGSGTLDRSLPQALSEPFGEITSSNCQTVEGWALDPLKLTSPLSFRVNVLKKGATAEQSLNMTVEANLPRIDIFTASVAQALNVNATDYSKHGFKFTLPSTVVEKDKIALYAMKGSWNPLLAEQTISCSGTQAGSGSSARSMLNAVTNYLTRSTTTGSGNTVNTTATSIVPGIGPRSWAEWENACRTSSASVCVIPTGGGGPQCVLGGGGGTQAERDFCQAMYESCGGGNRGGTITGLCDPGRYSECREDSRFVDRFGRVDTEACDRYLLGACNVAGSDRPQDAANCRPECVLNDDTDTPTGVPRPSDCPKGAGGSATPAGPTPAPNPNPPGSGTPKS